MTPYSERLRPSAPVWLLVPTAGLLAGSAAVPLGGAVAAVVAPLAAVVTAALLLVRAPQLHVDEDGLQAGRASLEARFIGPVEVLDAGQTREAMGTGLRADAHVLHRPWVRTAVRLELTDPDDPTPYWLVSTRRPHELAAALESSADAVAGVTDQAAHSEQTG